MSWDADWAKLNGVEIGDCISQTGRIRGEDYGLYRVTGFGERSILVRGHSIDRRREGREEQWQTMHRSYVLTRVSRADIESGAAEPTP